MALLVLKDKDGNVITEVPTIKGDSGVSVAKTEINQRGELVITLSDNTVSNLGVVVGAKGDRGDSGEKGETGATGATGAKGDKGDKGDNYILTGDDKINISNLVIHRGENEPTGDSKLWLDTSDNYPSASTWELIHTFDGDAMNYTEDTATEDFKNVKCVWELVTKELLTNHIDAADSQYVVEELPSPLRAVFIKVTAPGVYQGTEPSLKILTAFAANEYLGTDENGKSAILRHVEIKAPLQNLLTLRADEEDTDTQKKKQRAATAKIFYDKGAWFAEACKGCAAKTSFMALDTISPLSAFTYDNSYNTLNCIKIIGACYSTDNTDKIGTLLADSTIEVWGIRA